MHLHKSPSIRVLTSLLSTASTFGIISACIYEYLQADIFYKLCIYIKVLIDFKRSHYIFGGLSCMTCVIVVILGENFIIQDIE